MQRITLRHTAYLNVLILVTLMLMSFRNEVSENYISPTNDHDSTKGVKSLLDSINRDLANAERFELNSKVIPFVEDYLNKESDDLEKLKEWAKPYFLMYEKILTDNGLP